MTIQSPLAPGNVRHRSVDSAFAELLRTRYQNGGPKGQKHLQVRPLFRPTREAFEAFLSRYAPQSILWSSDLRDKLWKEVRGRHPEAFLIARRASGEREWEVDRCIRTVALRVYCDHLASTAADPGHLARQFLWEFRVKEDGSIVLRPFDNSISEKLFWTELYYELAVRRAFRQELGLMRMDARYFAQPYLVATSGTTYFKGGQQVSDVSHHPSDRFPGLWTHNELINDVYVMPEAFCRPWYYEASTRSIFVFGSLGTPPTVDLIRSLGITY